MNIELRSPDKVMKLSRLGSFHQSKLSFLRSFLKEFKDWEYRRDLFDLNKEGFGTAVYSGCKAFVDNLAKTCTVENLAKGITCNTLQLGYMDGGLTYKVPEPFRTQVKNSIPLKRWGKISEIENAVRYLINTEYVSGCSLKINGGLYL